MSTTTIETDHVHLWGAPQPHRINAPQDCQVPGCSVIGIGYTDRSDIWHDAKLNEIPREFPEWIHDPGRDGRRCISCGSSEETDEIGQCEECDFIYG